MAYDIEKLKGDFPEDVSVGAGHIVSFSINGLACGVPDGIAEILKQIPGYRVIECITVEDILPDAPNKEETQPLDSSGSTSFAGDSTEDQKPAETEVPKTTAEIQPKKSAPHRAAARR